MNMHLIRNIVVAVIGLIVIGVVWAAVRATDMNQGLITAPAMQAPVTSSTPDTSIAPGTPTVKVALLDFSGKDVGVARGCDHVVLVDRSVATTTAPLTTALRELFSIRDTQIGDLGNFMPKTLDTLSFDKVSLTNGVARVYLKGSLSGLAGVCDDPRASIQIEETALQFPSVKSVELYLNGQRTNLVPSEQ